jgi:hypothetical protein
LRELSRNRTADDASTDDDDVSAVAHLPIILAAALSPEP